MKLKPDKKEEVKKRDTKAAAPKKPKARDTSTMAFDLLYQLSYMSVVAAAGVPRDQIFARAAELPCAPAEYFNRVELACRRLHYDYAKACRLVGESCPEEDVKGLLLRFSTSLISGEPESAFLEREAAAQAEAYHNEYGRKLEALKLWSDAYVSLILSAVLVIIVGIVATMIWKIEMGFILGLVLVSVLTTALGVWLIYLMSPREIIVLGWAGSREQKDVRRLFRLLLPVALVTSALLSLKVGNVGWALVTIATLLFPIGFIASMDDRKVIKRDVELSSFLGSLGGVCAAVGTTVKEALGRIDLEAMNNLKKEVKSLHTRLAAGLRPRLCWKRFIDETGSELTLRSVGMFYDAIELGGEADKAGAHAALFANRISMLRAKRQTVSSPFRWLCFAMHASSVALLVFITEIMTIFGGMVAAAQKEIPKVAGGPSLGSFTSFNLSGLAMLHQLVIPLVVVFTLANALAPSIANGGSRYNILHNLSLTAAISGASLLILPRVSAMLFKTISF